MKYIIGEDYRLRGWTDRLANLEHFPTRKLTPLSVREHGLLSKCDGQTEVDGVKYAEQIKRFLAEGVIAETEGAALKDEQRYLFYNNRRFRKIDLSITGFCDFKCRHCFNAADHRPRNVQPKTEDILALIGSVKHTVYILRRERERE